MNNHEFAALQRKRQAEPEEPRTTAAVIGRHPRTLSYGPHLDGQGGKNTLHVYVRNRQIHRLVYSGDHVIEYHAAESFPTRSLIPTKRSMPQYCDFDFMAYAMDQGIDPNFTTWDERSTERGWFSGKIYEEISG